MSEFKNPFLPGGKFYNPKITDASKVTDTSHLSKFEDFVLGQGEFPKNVETEGTVYFYSSDGNLIGKGYNTDNISKVYLISDSKLTEFNESFQILTKGTYSEIYQKTVNKYHTKETFTQVLIKNYCTDIGMSNEELNVRAFLTLIKHHEGGKDEKAYNRWMTPPAIVKEQGDYDYFTDEAKLLGHPGYSPHNKSAAGAFQILLVEGWNEATSTIDGIALRKKLNINDFTNDNQVRFALGQIKYKKKALDLVEKGEFNDAAIKVKENWTCFKSLSESEINTEIKEILAQELNGNSEITIKQGLLLVNL